MIIRRNISDLYAAQPFFNRSNLPEKMKKQTDFFLKLFSSWKIFMLLD